MGKKHKKKNKNRNKHNNHNNQNNNQNNHHSQSESQNFQNSEPKYEEFNDLVDNNVYDAEKIDDNGSSKKNILTIVIVVFLALMLTVLILLTTGLLKRENLSFLNFASNNVSVESFLNTDSDDDAEAIEFVENIEELGVFEDENNNGADNNGLATFTTVRIPMLINDSYPVAAEMPEAGCDRIYWVTRNVSPTPAPLNATLNEMFSFDQELDFFIGNYAAKQENLSFDYAEIENRVAKIYLNGSIEKTETDCADRLAVQINWAALQFATIDSVEIYLNGELY
jgi:hypothetical protein